MYGLNAGPWNVYVNQDYSQQTEKKGQPKHKCKTNCAKYHHTTDNNIAKSRGREPPNSDMINKTYKPLSEYQEKNFSRSNSNSLQSYSPLSINISLELHNIICY